MIAVIPIATSLLLIAPVGAQQDTPLVLPNPESPPADFSPLNYWDEAFEDFFVPLFDIPTTITESGRSIQERLLDDLDRLLGASTGDAQSRQEADRKTHPTKGSARTASSARSSL